MMKHQVGVGFIKLHCPICNPAITKPDAPIEERKLDLELRDKTAQLRLVHQKIKLVTDYLLELQTTLAQLASDVTNITAHLTIVKEGE